MKPSTVLGWVGPLLVLLVPAVVWAELARGLAPPELWALIESGRSPVVLDVRTEEEFSAGRVPGAVNIPVRELLGRIEELGAHRAGAVVVYCETGPRASFASWMLGRAGFERIDLLSGHMAGWRRAGLPTEP